MEYMEQDLTRYYLLHSHSRGSADEMLPEAEILSAEWLDVSINDAPYGENADANQWKGKKETNHYMKLYYE
ncbi:hypothetical protein [Paenibacillus sediminis]|uniref:Uncharacterized protein n=1 Tax=Paenibacillus sediminis TaxID=664909 RepID=A0ABS4H567_9BACL|nr:hypothetical protein [Paenibacillus sediminis]MBP1937678.1 hypothetical protein [Paenibacillus sediminis]